jgi:hypothetical protein
VHGFACDKNHTIFLVFLPVLIFYSPLIPSSLWSKLPRLRDLALFKGVPQTRLLDLPYQHRIIIKDIVPNVPAGEILRVTLADSISWCRSDRWHPTVPFEDREDFRMSLGYSHANLVDFRGFIASLFRPEELSDGLRSQLFSEREG